MTVLPDLGKGAMNGNEMTGKFRETIAKGMKIRYS